MSTLPTTRRSTQSGQPKAAGQHTDMGNHTSPIARYFHPSDHEVRFTYGVPSSSEILRRRNPKNSLPDRHFRASTRRHPPSPVNDPG